MGNNQSDDWRQRELLLRRAQHDQHSLAYTYKRYYQAAKVAGLLAWSATALTAIIGTVLLYVITSQTFNFPIFQQYLEGTGNTLAILLLIVSLLNAFYSPQARATRYYRAGQDLQELYDEFDNFSDLKIANLNRDLTSLKEEYHNLHRRRHKLNQAAPQLSGLWYRMMTWELNLVTTFRSLIPSRTGDDQETTVKDIDEADTSANPWEESLEQKVADQNSGDT